MLLIDLIKYFSLFYEDITIDISGLSIYSVGIESINISSRHN